MFTTRFPVATLARFRRCAVLGAIGILGAAPFLAVAQDGAYPPPPTPRLVPEDAPSLNPLDAEVDVFLRVKQAQAQFTETPGQGLAVVVIDGGINSQHISFQGQILPGLNLSEEAPGDRADTTDHNGHGSNVAGIIAAKTVSPAEGMPAGIAPAPDHPHQGLPRRAVRQDQRGASSGCSRIWTRTSRTTMSPSRSSTCRWGPGRTSRTSTM